MTKKICSGLLLAATIAMAPAPVDAQTAPSGWSSWASVFTFQDCGGSNFWTCISVDVRVSGNTVGAYVLNNGGPATLTRIGIVNLGGTIMDPPGTSSTSNGAWNPEANNGLSGGGLPDGRWAWTSPNGINNGLLNGQSGYFTFNVEGLVLSQIGIAVHGQGGPQGCSTKYGVWQTPGGLVTNDAVANGGQYVCYDVPEPESMALLSTGILGLAFVVTRRRRYELELVDEDEQNAQT